MPNKMVPEVKAKWLAALRSGEFKQGRVSLHKVWSQGVERFCCLGVLCKLAADEGVIPAPGGLPNGGREYAGAVSFLPPLVRKWAGISDAFGDYGTGNLAYDNDKGKTFAEVADIIEREF